ncbi:hypothetical protein D3C85_1326040 [compost metagenome]
MLDEFGHVTLGKKRPCLVDNHDFLSVAIAQKHGLLDLVDQLQENHLLKMLTPLQLLQFKDSKGVFEVDVVSAVEVLAVHTLRGKREQLLADILDPGVRVSQK